MKKPFMSVIIPSYEMSGQGLKFLDHSLFILDKQSFKDFEIVVSDHSINDSLNGVCDMWRKNLNIKYVRCEEKRGVPSANMNNCILNSDGNYIKILCQDDFLYDSESLMKTCDCLKNNPNAKWLASKYIHTCNGINYYREHIPVWNDNIHVHNTIGTYSCASFINEKTLFFDDNLSYYMDCEFYKRFKDKYGLPVILTETTMVNRIWEGAMTSTIATTDLRNKEYTYLVNKYGLL